MIPHKKVIFAIAVLGFTSTADAEPNACVIAGPQDAPITIEEYADFECPYCAKGAATVNRLLKEYPGKIKVVLRNMPLPMHANALPAAKAVAAVCMQDPSKAKTFHTTLFANQDQLAERGEDYIIEAARASGADIRRMKVDMEGEAVAQRLQADKLAVEKHGLTGVPSYRIGSEKFVGARPLEEFKRIVDRQLKSGS